MNIAFHLDNPGEPSPFEMEIWESSGGQGPCVRRGCSRAEGSSPPLGGAEELVLGIRIGFGGGVKAATLSQSDSVYTAADEPVVVICTG